MQYLGSADPAAAEDFLPRTNADGSTTFLGSVDPAFVVLPWPIGSVVRSGAGEVPQLPPVDRTPRIERKYFADVYGWPMGSAAVVYSRDVAMFQPSSRSAYRLEIRLPLGGWRSSLASRGLGSMVPRALPLFPWPGILIDGLLYGLITWLMVVAFRASRGRARLRRGLCPNCGYPRGSTGSVPFEACSECGLRFRHSKSVSTASGAKREGATPRESISSAHESP
jgi:hypothetical protein